MSDISNNDNQRFLALLTVGLIIASLYIFSPFLKYLLVAAVLALSTSHAYVAVSTMIHKSHLTPQWLKRSNRVIAASLFTLFFLLMIFVPLLYFLTVTYDQLSGLNIGEIKNTALQIWAKFVSMTENIPILEQIFQHLKKEGASLINGSSIEAAIKAGENMVSGAGGLIFQVSWILIFYFLFNLYGASILHFLATLLPTTPKHEKYLYKECTGTVAVVFYGSLFNMVAQGIAFGILMAFIGGYDSVYLGVLAGFCSIIPLVGAALVYIPVVVLEILGGKYISAIIIVVFAWTVMGFLIDNFLRLFFISNLKKMFGFEYTMNEVLILLSILAGIATLGFWGLIIGPSVVALTLAAANICRDLLGEEEHTPQTGC
jgi:predicted PurR-regulated permease PerM